MLPSTVGRPPGHTAGGRPPQVTRRGADPQVTRQGGRPPQVTRRGADPQVTRRGADPRPPPDQAVDSLSGLVIRWLSLVQLQLVW